MVGEQGQPTVLVIAYYFPPMGMGGVQRIAKFVKYLPEYGWQPVVLTATPSAYFAFDPTLLEELERRRIPIVRTPGDGLPRWIRRRFKNPQIGAPPEWLETAWRLWSQFRWIPDRAIGWKPEALSLGRRLLREYRPAILLATAPPYTDFLLAHELAAAAELPFVLDYRDLWVGDPLRRYPTPWHRRRNECLERAVLVRMARAVVPTRALKEELLRRYGDLLEHEDIAIIPHGYDAEDFAGLEHLRPPEERFVIAHVGTFEGGSPQATLQAIAQFLERHPGARRHMEIRWVGLVRPREQRMVKELQLGDVVRILGYLPHREAIAQMLQAHVLWSEAHVPLRSPGKLFEYLGARRTLLVCAPAGAIRRIAEESRAAFCAEPGDVATLHRHVEELYERWRQGELPVPSEDYVAQFERRRLTGELARLLGFHAAL